MASPRRASRTKTKPKAAPAAKTAPARPPPGGDVDDAALLALDASQAEAPDIPVSIAVAEWKSLASVARKELRTLSRLGIGAQPIATLEALARRLTQLEKAWQSARGKRVTGAATDKQRVAAEALKREMLAAGEWACRHDDYALKTLARIREGTGLADTVQDLRDLASFWEQHDDERARTKLRAADLDRARSLADALSAPAGAESRDPDAARAQELRNRCFWAGNVVAGEIRQCGRYAFSDDPKRAARFPARYRAELRRPPRSPSLPAPAETRPYALAVDDDEDPEV